MALIFLVIITLISLGGMRTTTMELRMAGNEQEHTQAVQAAQSAIDGALSMLTPANFSTTGAAVCFNTSSDRDGNACTLPTFALTDPDGATYGPANVVLQFLNTAMVPRSRTPTSISNFQAGVFQFDSLYDDTTNGGGRANVFQGFALVIPGSTN